MESSGEKKLFKSVKISQNYGRECGPAVLVHPVYLCFSNGNSQPMVPIVSAYLRYVWTIACVKVRISSITAT